VLTIIDEDDPCVILGDGRGCYKRITFYENYPELEINHDESTFRSGEMSAFKWIFPENMPFFNKGRGQSIMLSLFMIQHNSNDIFQLSETEREKAIEKSVICNFRIVCFDQNGVYIGLLDICKKLGLNL
ncbi:unnamed protein product, partial [Brachionus calyciflorus]